MMTNLKHDVEMKESVFEMTWVSYLILILCISDDKTQTCHEQNDYLLIHLNN